MGYAVRVWVCAATVAAAAGPASHARAEFEPAGAISAAGTFPGGGDLGGELLVDLGIAHEWFQLGMVLGVGAISSENDDRSRAFMPFGVSAAFAPDLGVVGPVFRVRAGGWGGATNDGLTAGGLLSGGAQLAVSLGRAVRLLGGVEFTALLGHGSVFAVGPCLGLMFTPDGPGL